MNCNDLEIVGDEVRALGFTLVRFVDGCPPSLREEFEQLLMTLEHDDMPEPY